MRDDPNKSSNLASTAAVYSDLGALLGRRDSAEAQSLFTRARELLEKARNRSPRDETIRRTMVQTTGQPCRSFSGDSESYQSRSRHSTVIRQAGA